MHGIGEGAVRVDPEEAQAACINIRDWVRNVVHPELGKQIRVIYGGEVNSEEAERFIR